MAGYLSYLFIVLEYSFLSIVYYVPECNFRRLVGQSIHSQYNADPALCIFTDHFEAASWDNFITLKFSLQMLPVVKIGVGKPNSLIWYDYGIEAAVIGHVPSQKFVAPCLFDPHVQNYVLATLILEQNVSG